jgi:hypothetical protein
MKIKSIDYEIEPINDFFRIVIFEEENKFKIGLSFIGNFGTDSFIIFKNLIVGAMGYMANKEDVDRSALRFDSFEECQIYLENMTIKKFKKEFTKGEIKDSKFLIAQRF